MHLRPPSPSAVSDLSGLSAGSHRFRDGFEGRHGVDHLTQRDWIGRAPGDRVGEGFEVDPDRVAAMICLRCSECRVASSTASISAIGQRGLSSLTSSSRCIFGVIAKLVRIAADGVAKS
jgi:hypothetical protein